MLGDFTGYKSGHRLNNDLLRALIQQKNCYEEVSFEDARRSPISYQLAPSLSE